MNRTIQSAPNISGARGAGRIHCWTLLAIMTLSVADATAQLRKNDQKYAAQSAPAFDDPTRVSPNRSTEGRLAGGDITIEWGAPHVRGRQVSGGLVSTYKVWRTGANEATVIHFPQDVVVEGEPLAAGTYSLFTIGGKKAWTIIFNADAQQ
ncbi:MAG: hypothetical protein ACI80V_001013 [Rhodothermales bacterium]|jgi:hypothetical protein